MNNPFARIVVKYVVNQVTAIGVATAVEAATTSCLAEEDREDSVLPSLASTAAVVAITFPGRKYTDRLVDFVADTRINAKAEVSIDTPQ